MKIRKQPDKPEETPICPIEFAWMAGSPSSPALPASSEPRPSGCWPSAARASSQSTARSRISKAAIKDLPASAEALAVTADVTQEDEVAEYVRAALDKFGTIDAFYNNAGIEGDIKPIPEYSLESFRRVLDVNVVGVFLGMKHVLPVMLKQNKGSIINTASIAGLMGSPHIAVYSASKHAVIGLTKSAAWECTGTGVRVNCVCPGLIDSRMLSDHLAGPQWRQRADAQRKNRRADSGAAARPGLGSRLHRRVPRLR